MPPQKAKHLGGTARQMIYQKKQQHRNVLAACELWFNTGSLRPSRLAGSILMQGVSSVILLGKILNSPVLVRPAREGQHSGFRLKTIYVGLRRDTPRVATRIGHTIANTADYGTAHSQNNQHEHEGMKQTLGMKGGKRSCATLNKQQQHMRTEPHTQGVMAFRAHNDAN